MNLPYSTSERALHKKYGEEVFYADREQPIMRTKTEAEKWANKRRKEGFKARVNRYIGGRGGLEKHWIVFLRKD